MRFQILLFTNCAFHHESTHNDLFKSFFIVKGIHPPCAQTTKKKRKHDQKQQRDASGGAAAQLLADVHLVRAAVLVEEIRRETTGAFPVGRRGGGCATMKNSKCYKTYRGLERKGQNPETETVDR